MAKAKKMTQKEFKAVLEKVGMNFEVWGWEGILNMISGYNEFLSEEAIKMGSENVYRHEKNIADAIFDELDKRGYYDSIKEGRLI